MDQAPTHPSRSPSKDETQWSGGGQAESLGRLFLHGVSWTAVGSYGRVAVQLGVNVILARKLRPAEFGVVAMVTVYTGFVALISEAGLSAAVIQKRDFRQEDLSSFFWFSLVLGAALAGLSWAVAPLLERFYGYRGLTQVVRLMSGLFLFVGANAVPMGLLKKAVRFRALALAGLLATTVAGGLAIWAAFAGWGYWALVVNALGASGLGVLFNFALARWRPWFRFRLTSIRRALSYSLGVLGFNAVNYWARTADRLIIGKALGAAPLGYYSQGYKLLLLPLSTISGIVTPTVHPILARIQDDPERMGRTYLRLIGVISAVSFPLGAFLAVFAEPVVLTLWGPQWGPSVPVVRALAILVMLQPPATVSGPVLLARNRSDLYFALSLGATVVMLAGMLIGLRWGFVGVAVGYASAWTLGAVPMIFAALKRAIPLQVSAVSSAVSRPLLASLAVAGLGLGAESLLPGSPLLALAAGSLLCIAAVGFVLSGFRRDIAALLARRSA